MDVSRSSTACPYPEGDGHFCFKEARRERVHKAMNAKGACLALDASSQQKHQSR